MTRRHLALIRVCVLLGQQLSRWIDASSSEKTHSCREWERKKTPARPCAQPVRDGYPRSGSQHHEQRADCPVRDWQPVYLHALLIRQMQCFLGHGRGVIYTFPGDFFFNILSLLISPKWRMLSRTSHTSKHTHTDFAKDPNLVVRPQNMFWNSVSAEITTLFGKWFCHCCFDSIRIPGDQVPGSTHGVFMAKLYI